MLKISFGHIKVFVVEWLTKFNSTKARLRTFVDTTMMDCISIRQLHVPLKLFLIRIAEICSVFLMRKSCYIQRALIVIHIANKPFFHMHQMRRQTFFPHFPQKTNDRTSKVVNFWCTQCENSRSALIDGIKGFLCIKVNRLLFWKCASRLWNTLQGHVTQLGLVLISYFVTATFVLLMVPPSGENLTLSITLLILNFFFFYL